MVRRSTTGNNRNVISKRLQVAMTRAKDDLHLMVLQRFFFYLQNAVGRRVYASRTRFDGAPQTNAASPLKS